ncbi:copper resistance CopC/CopD family protein [Candidatus Poriferisocius sp.]|uniref:copper resistance CopC/CopD family protein n=1 Tax=Candidatus Poriferisocius sp. TaxID=3101276 RepID=UPI003B02C754
MAVWPASAAAHTELESSHPSDGDAVDEPVSQISLTFTRPVEPVSDGFIAFDEQGIERAPDTVESTDGQTWVMRYETPLPRGRIEVYWRVTAADGHILEGTFVFTVLQSESGPTIAPSPGPQDAQDTGPVPTIVEPKTPVPDDPPSAATKSPEAPSPTEAPSTPPPTTLPSAGSTASDGSSPSPTTGAEEPDAEVRSTSSFAPQRNSAATVSHRIAEVTRILIFLATMGVVGGLAFLAFIVRGESRDSDRVRRWVSGNAIVLAASAAVAALNRAVVIEREWSAFWSPDAIADAVSTQFGVAAGLRLLGGLVLVGAFWRAVENPPRGPIVGTVLMGGALVIASFAFDGHTVTEGPRWLHSIASVSHVSAAAVWSGGVVLLADLLWRRHRRGADVFRPLMRFSRMAATALVLAGVAGTVMAILVLDRFDDLWSTQWGRLLLAKIALVAVAAAIGGHNRWVLIPAVERHGEDIVHLRLRRAAIIEAIALMTVAVITAFLVAASAV